jgi:hypothetical protein
MQVPRRILPLFFFLIQTTFHLCFLVAHKIKAKRGSKTQEFDLHMKFVMISLLIVRIKIV